MNIYCKDPGPTGEIAKEFEPSLILHFPSHWKSFPEIWLEKASPDIGQTQILFPIYCVGMAPRVRLRLKCLSFGDEVLLQQTSASGFSYIDTEKIHYHHCNLLPSIKLHIGCIFFTLFFLKVLETTKLIGNYLNLLKIIFISCQKWYLLELEETNQNLLDLQLSLFKMKLVHP